jgi:hypothetical protein
MVLVSLDSSSGALPSNTSIFLQLWRLLQPQISVEYHAGKRRLFLVLLFLILFVSAEGGCAELVMWCSEELEELGYA